MNMSEIDERKKKLDKIRGFDYNEFTQIHRNPLEWLVNQNIPKENFLCVQRKIFMPS